MANSRQPDLRRKPTLRSTHHVSRNAHGDRHTDYLQRKTPASTTSASSASRPYPVGHPGEDRDRLAARRRPVRDADLANITAYLIVEPVK